RRRAAQLLPHEAAEWAIYCWDKPGMEVTHRGLLQDQKSYVKPDRPPPRGKQRPWSAARLAHTEPRFVRFSNRPRSVKHFQAVHQLQCQCRSRALASLRTRHQGPSIMGFEDEVEQSFGRACRQYDGRFKRTNELTSSIVPRGTSFHRWVDLDFLLLHLILQRSQAAVTSGTLSGNLRSSSAP